MAFYEDLWNIDYSKYLTKFNHPSVFIHGTRDLKISYLAVDHQIKKMNRKVVNRLIFSNHNSQLPNLLLMAGYSHGNNLCSAKYKASEKENSPIIYEATYPVNPQESQYRAFILKSFDKGFIGRNGSTQQPKASCYGNMPFINSIVSQIIKKHP